MTPRRCVAAMATLIGAFWGCSASTEQTAKVTAISPATAFNDVAFPASIAGDAFRPIYRFDTMAAATQMESGSFSVALTPAGGSTNGSAADSIPLDGVTWLSPAAIAATVPAGIPAGTYDVVVTDPRGTRVTLDGGFVSLGPDTEEPSVVIESPVAGHLIAAGTLVTVTLVADDHDGFLASLGATIAAMGDKDELVCTVAPVPHQAPCAYHFVAPVPTDDNAIVVITPHATDTAGNQAETAPATFRLVLRPTLASVLPASGPATGGTAIFVEGANFIRGPDGSRVLLDGHAIDSNWVSASEIHAVMPRHDPGMGIVSVANGDAETDVKVPFQFIGEPVLRLAYPLKGPVTGGTRIAITGNNFRFPQTLITIGGAKLLEAEYKSAIRIEGVVPPAAGGAPGPVSIVATDDPLGATSTLQTPFVYERAGSDSPDAGAPPADPVGAP